MPPKSERRREREWGESQPNTPALGGAAAAAKWPAEFPPPTGPIDVNKFDLPQGLSALEWWYFNCHVTSKRDSSRIFSIFSSFFRQADLSTLTPEEVARGDKRYEYYDACTWALSDPVKKAYYSDSLLDHRACSRIEALLDPAVTGKPNQHAEGPLLEWVRQGRLPQPDRMMKSPSAVRVDKLDINLNNDCILTSRPYDVAIDGPVPSGSLPIVYTIKCYNPNRVCRAELTFVPERGVVRHGDSGIVNKMFYYYVPRMRVHGFVQVGGERHEVEGPGWYDREFGGSRDVTGRDAVDAWTWFSCMLNDNTEFSLFNIVDREKLTEKEMVGVLTDASGTRIVVHDVQLQYSNLWTSMNTYQDYPTQWKITVPSLSLELHVACAFAHQEFITVLVTGGGFFEGRTVINGVRAGKAVTGQGFLERKNHIPYKDTDGLLKNVGRFVKKTLAELYPLEGTQDWINENVLGRHCTGATNSKQVCDTLFAPVRALIDRGGKSWRSLILVSSINALTRETHMDCSRYIALAELLHVGSLIIDDIQDESVVRRGGRCVHLDYGVATAINAGTGCYFMAPILAKVHELPDRQAIQMYNLYFDVLRAGHAGQGLDICGLAHLMPKAVETGENTELKDFITAVHVYKTGGACGTLCKMACVLTDALPGQHDAMENFGVQIGLAFQIVDDALNLRGFDGDLKEIGEDVRDGKVTYPVIKAMGRLNRADRQYVWQILQEKTSDRGKIMSVIDKLNSVAAIDDCLVEARNLVEDAWEVVDRELPDTLPKLMVRTFCSYLTVRTF